MRFIVQTKTGTMLMRVHPNHAYRSIYIVKLSNILLHKQHSNDSMTAFPQDVYGTVSLLHSNITVNKNVMNGFELPLSR